MPRRPRGRPPEMQPGASPFIKLFVASSLFLGAYAILSRAWAAVRGLLAARRRRLLSQLRREYFSQLSGGVDTPIPGHLQSPAASAAAAAAARRRHATSPRPRRRNLASASISSTAAEAGPASASSGAKISEGARSSEHPFASPARYLPEAADPSTARALNVREVTLVRAGNSAWVDGDALLDTGNSHMTVIDTRFAEVLGLYSRDPQSLFGRPIRHATLRGVVPGAEVLTPVIMLTLTIRAQEFTVEAAVSEMSGQHLLLGLDVLEPLFKEGFSLGAAT